MFISNGLDVLQNRQKMTPDELAELLAEMDVDPDLLANLEDDDIEDLACMWALCGTTVTVRLTNGRTFRGMLLKVTPVNLVVSSRCIEYPSWYLSLIHI